MPEKELAAAESAARIQRWRDAATDLNDRKVDPGPVLGELEKSMTDAEIKQAREP